MKPFSIFIMATILACGCSQTGTLELSEQGFLYNGKDVTPDELAAITKDAKRGDFVVIFEGTNGVERVDWLDLDDATTTFWEDVWSSPGDFVKFDQRAKEMQVAEVLDAAIIPRLDMRYAHLPDVTVWLEEQWTALHPDGSPELLFVNMCVPPSDPGKNPFNVDMRHSGPHVGCNLRHVIVARNTVSFRDALDAICESAGVRWYVKGNTVCIDGRLTETGE